MKTVTVDEARRQLSQLIAEACQGEVVVLKDGEKTVTLSPGREWDLEEDSPELEAELLKAAKTPFTPLSNDELRAACERIADKKRGG